MSSKSNTLLLVYVCEGGGREGGEGEGGVQLNTKITNRYTVQTFQDRYSWVR